jgi:Tetratricopeptide repeat
MCRLVVAILCLILAAPIIAQVPTPANVTAQLAEQSVKREEAERKLLIREAADELEDAQTEQAYNRFENVMGAFSVLITLLVIVFGFRTEKAASAAAKQEVATAKADIDRLVAEARDAAAAAKAAQEALAVTKAEIDALLMSIRSDATEAKKNAVEIAEEQARAVKIVENLNKMSATDRATPKLSREDEKIVEAAAKESFDKPEADLTIDEYKTRIGKARFIDKNWVEVLRLARAMAKAHADDEALAFALNAQGDVQRELNLHDEAVETYDEVIRRFGETNDADLQQHCMWAMHFKSYSLIEQGLAADAEAELRALLPLRERIDGAEHRFTLAARHQLARSILDQGRAADAEAELRALLPLCERVNGAELSDTLVTRHELSRAILDQGRAAEAEAELRTLLPLGERVNGAEHSETLATRHQLARAILDQGRAADAEVEFRALLPLCERVDGVEHSGTFVTRYCLARAVLENGNVAEAVEILAPIPESPGNADWPERHSAHLAVTRACVADGLGDGDAAVRWLASAKAHFDAAFPPDHYYRQQFDAYVAAREKGAS